MLDKLEEIEKRHDELTRLLSKPEIIERQEEYQRLAKEFSDLEKTVAHYREYKKLALELEENRNLLKEADEEIRRLARDEIGELQERMVGVERALKISLLPRDPSDEKNTFLEIRAGTGGEEAGLFVADLFRMYVRYSELRNWKIDIVSRSETGVGGLKEIIALIEGRGAYRQLKYDIDAGDLRIDVYRSSGPGGQSVNTTDSAVRITHTPTGLVVTCQDEKSQHKNKARALKILRSKLLDLQRFEQQREISEKRRSMVGTGDRSERIRTYNFPQNRVTDHRIGITLYRLDEILEGNIQEIIEALIAHFQAEALKAQIEN